MALLALSAYFVYCYLQETKKLRIPALLCVDQLISSHRNSTQLNSFVSGSVSIWVGRVGAAWRWVDFVRTEGVKRGVGVFSLEAVSQSLTICPLV